MASLTVDNAHRIFSRFFLQLFFPVHANYTYIYVTMPKKKTNPDCALLLCMVLTVRQLGRSWSTQVRNAKVDFDSRNAHPMLLRPARWGPHIDGSARIRAVWHGRYGRAMWRGPSPQGAICSAA